MSENSYIYIHTYMYTQLGYAYAYITDTQTKASPNRKQDSKLERRGFIDDILESLGNGNLGPVITEQPVGAGDGAAQATVTVTVTETAPAGAAGGDQAYVEKKRCSDDRGGRGGCRGGGSAHRPGHTGSGGLTVNCSRQCGSRHDGLQRRPGDDSDPGLDDDDDADD